MSDDVDRVVAGHRADLHLELDAWLDELIEKSPDADLGEAHVFKVTGWRNGYDDNDRPVMEFTIKSEASKYLR